MTNLFDPRVSDLDPRDGSVTVTPFPPNWGETQRFDLAITVSFSSQEATTDVEREILRQQRGRLQFSYVVKDFPYRAWLTQLAEVVAKLFHANAGAFQHLGFMNGGSPDPVALQLALREMAKLGSNYFHKLFHLKNGPNFESSSLPRGEFDVYGKLLLAWLRKAETIQITAARHLIPWPILFNDDPRAEQISVDGFWGYAKNLQLLHDGLTTSTYLRAAWRMVTAVDHSDPDLNDGAKIHEDATHPFVLLKDRVESAADPQELFDAFSEADILYHYGHASASSRGFDLGVIDVNGKELNAADLERLILDDQIHLPPHKPLLVFLNGCSTAAGAGDVATIPDVLVKYGVGSFCFIATLGAVPPCPAARFALSFFIEHLGARGTPKPLGLSILEARRQVLKVYGNPVGLLYVAYGRVSTTVDFTHTTPDQGPQPQLGELAHVE